MPIRLRFPTLFGCGGHAACAVIDPVGGIGPYLRAADTTGMRIRFVIDTHIHAGHRSAGRALASETGAEYVVHAGADVTFPFYGVNDGDQLPLGNVVVDVMHTRPHAGAYLSPGHGSHAGHEPWFVLTGHTLMVGDVGRTELVDQPADGARTLFASLQRLKAAPVGAGELRAWNSGRHAQ
jgi:glyoxylase-like metal-dependent hydrolase (beta-lactamase superfamily II)